MKRPRFETFKRDGPDWMAAGWEWGGASNDDRIRISEEALAVLVKKGVSGGVQLGKKVSIETDVEKGIGELTKKLLALELDMKALRRRRWMWLLYGIGVSPFIAELLAKLGF